MKKVESFFISLPVLATLFIGPGQTEEALPFAPGCKSMIAYFNTLSSNSLLLKTDGLGWRHPESKSINFQAGYGARFFENIPSRITCGGEYAIFTRFSSPVPIVCHADLSWHKASKQAKIYAYVCNELRE